MFLSSRVLPPPPLFQTHSTPRDKTAVLIGMRVRVSLENPHEGRSPVLASVTSSWTFPENHPGDLFWSFCSPPMDPAWGLHAPPQSLPMGLPHASPCPACLIQCFQGVCGRLCKVISPLTLSFCCLTSCILISATSLSPHSHSRLLGPRTAPPPFPASSLQSPGSDHSPSSECLQSVKVPRSMAGLPARPPIPQCIPPPFPRGCRGC